MRVRAGEQTGKKRHDENICQTPHNAAADRSKARLLSLWPMGWNTEIRRENDKSDRDDKRNHLAAGSHRP
jgi:hypothetical protein